MKKRLLSILLVLLMALTLLPLGALAEGECRLTSSFERIFAARKIAQERSIFAECDNPGP